MIIGKATKESEAGTLPKPEAFAAMGKYNDEHAAPRDRESQDQVDAQ